MGFKMGMGIRVVVNVKYINDEAFAFKYRSHLITGTTVPLQDALFFAGDLS